MSACSQQRTLATPREAEHWSLATLRVKLVKVGAKVIAHGRYVTFQLVEVTVPDGRIPKGHPQRDELEKKQETSELRAVVVYVTTPLRLSVTLSGSGPPPRAGRSHIVCGQLALQLHHRPQDPGP